MRAHRTGGAAQRPGLVVGTSIATNADPEVASIRYQEAGENGKYLVKKPLPFGKVCGALGMFYQALQRIGNY
jgi:hypothetical protein